MKDIWEVWKENENVDLVYDTAIAKYEGEIKGFQIMLRREELSEHSDFVKRRNCEIWKKSIRKAKWNLTRTKTLKNEIHKSGYRDNGVGSINM